MTDSAAKFDPEYFKGYIVPDENKIGKTGKRSAILKDQRIQRLYKRQLEGLPVRQLVLDHRVFIIIRSLKKYNSRIIKM